MNDQDFSSSQDDALVVTLPELRTRVSDRGILTIKPRVLFQLTEERFGGESLSLNLQIPSSQIGSVTMLEAAQIVALLHILAPSNIVEFGTFHGYSSRLFLENSNESCRVVTIDLPDDTPLDESARCASEASLHSDGDTNDEFLRWQSIGANPRFLRGITPSARRRLTSLKVDSRLLTAGRVQDHLAPGRTVVFVDGGHDVRTVRSDTELASELAGDNGMIIWHDFRSSIHSGVTPIVETRSETSKIFAIENTLLAFEPCGFDVFATRNVRASDDPSGVVG